MRTCVVVPMYNEQAIAKDSIDTILSYTKNIPAVVTLLIVNDASSDATKIIVEEKINQINDANTLQMVSHTKNRGYGAANRTGAEFAKSNNYDYVVFMDSDLTDHPEYLVKLYEKMQEGWDYIKTTRFANGGGYKKVLWKRRIIAKCGNIFARIVTGLPLTDIANGFRAVKVDVLKKIDLKEEHFALIVEEIMKAKKITDSFCEIPRIQGTRSDEARVSLFTYDINTYWKYLKYLFI